jgi:DNA-binding NtrC family response regulator
MPKGKILVIDDDINEANAINDMLTLEGFSVRSAYSGTEGLSLYKRYPFDVVVSDYKMPDIDGFNVFLRLKTFDSDIVFIIITAYGTIPEAVKALHMGVFHYLPKPVNYDELSLMLQRGIENRRLKDENKDLRAQIESKRIVGRSKKIEEVMDLVRTVAKSEATVMIRGESGTGKELIAQAIHSFSNRSSAPFIKVNCAAIPENLLEDELFGHEKGAFTDASRPRKGKFELAHGGTVFLDEIGDMSPALQVKVLRVLQEREFERLGGSEVIQVDVRLIAATNQDLEEKIKAGSFREDLYYRINVIPILIPPLRVRKEDIHVLVDHFIKKFNAKNNKNFRSITSEAQKILMGYNWPGNVRELENIIERAVVLGQGDLIRPDDLPLQLHPAEITQEDIISRLFDTDFTLEDLEKELIKQSLERSSWNQSKAAKLLGLTRRTLQYRVDKYNIARPTKRAEDN